MSAFALGVEWKCLSFDRSIFVVVVVVFVLFCFLFALLGGNAFCFSKIVTIYFVFMFLLLFVWLCCLFGVFSLII